MTQVIDVADGKKCPACFGLGRRLSVFGTPAPMACGKCDGRGRVDADE